MQPRPFSWLQKRRSRLRRWPLLAAFLFVLPTAVPATAQTTSDTTHRPRIGLVLSGGSAKGFAHIGVIQVLRELGVPIDVITGTSMGALIGGLYAAGYDVEEIVDIADGLDWAAIFTDRIDRRLLSAERNATQSRATFAYTFRDGRFALPSGAVRGANVMRLFQRLTWPVQHVRDFTQLRVPFAAIATDLKTGEAVVLKEGYLAEAMRASMALPAVFDPVQLNGRTLVDGGLARNLPAQDARDLGAEVIICSDVSDDGEQETRTLIDVLMQSIDLQMEAATRTQRPLCDVLIRPSTRGLSRADFNRLHEWVTRGRVAAQAQTSNLLPFAAGSAAVPALEQRFPDHVVISRIEITGGSPEAQRVALRAINLPVPGRYNADYVDLAVARLYATELFSRATYRVTAEGADTTLVFTIAEQAASQVGFGLRFDDHRKAALQFDGTLHSWLNYGSTLRLGLRLGEQTVVRASYIRGLGITSSFSRGIDANYTRALFDIYDGDMRTAEVRAISATLNGVIGTSLSRTSALFLRAGVERVENRTNVAAQDTSVEQTYAVLTATLLRNAANRRAYPTRGISLHLQSSIAETDLGGELDYSIHTLGIEQLLPLSRGFTLRARLFLGLATGDELPIQHRIFMGGAYPSPVFSETQPGFWGLRPQERSGKAAQIFQLALQKQVRGRLFATVGGNVGNTFEEWMFRPRDYIGGWAASIGMATVFGPVELTAHGRSLDRWPHLDVNIGYAF